MTFDMNDAEPQKSCDLIPDGTFAKVTMTIRPGGTDGESSVDAGLLKRSAAPGSDVLMLDCEFIVTEGPHLRRKFWQTFTTSGGKVDENGVSIGAKITKSTLRAMIDSALGLDPADMSEATKAKRILRGFGYVHKLLWGRYPHHRFCSKGCLDCGSGQAARNKEMIDKTDMEARAIQHARRNLAETLTAMGLMAPFFDRSAADIDRVIEACVDGFQDGMQRQTPERDPLECEIPF